jgi:hypothetical protein
MKMLVKVTTIGAWDCGRMRRCAYMKQGDSARGASFGFLSKGRKIKLLVIVVLLFLWELCALMF